MSDPWKEAELLSEQEWCAHGPALNCKDCRIEELEAEKDIGWRQVALSKQAKRIEALQAELIQVRGLSAFRKDEIERLQAESERLRKALRQIRKQHPPGGEAYIADQALAVQEDIDDT
jgi:capsule polysaccharide export protein KpsE/RkpR